MSALASVYNSNAANPFTVFLTINGTKHKNESKPKGKKNGRKNSNIAAGIPPDVIVLAKMAFILDGDLSASNFKSMIIVSLFIDTDPGPTNQILKALFVVGIKTLLRPPTFIPLRDSCNPENLRLVSFMILVEVVLSLVSGRVFFVTDD